MACKMGSAEKSHWTGCLRVFGKGEVSSMSWAGGSGMKTGQMSGDEGEGQGQVQVAMGSSENSSLEGQEAANESIGQELRKVGSGLNNSFQRTGP